MINNKEINEDLKFIPLNIKKQFIGKNSTWVPLIDGDNIQLENLNEKFLVNFENNINNLSLEQRDIRVLNNVDDNMLPNIKKEKFEENFDLEYPSETYEEELYSYNKDDCKNTSNNLNYNNQIKNNNPNNNNMGYSNEINNNNYNKNLNNNEKYYSNDLNNNGAYNNNNQNKYGNNYDNLSNKVNNNPNNNGNDYNNNLNNNEAYNNNNKNKYGNNYNNLNNKVNSNPNNNGNDYNNNLNNNDTYNNNQNTDEPVELDYYKELIHMSLLRSVDFNSNSDTNFRGNKLSSKIDEIFNQVKSEDSIVETFKVYNIPKPISDLVIKKIIKIALENYECK